MTTFETPLDINEGSRATPGLWNRIKDAHWGNYNALDDRVDDLASTLSSEVITNKVVIDRGAALGVQFRKYPNPLSGDTWQVWAERSGAAVVIGKSSNQSYVYFGSGDVRFLGGQESNSGGTQRLRLLHQQAHTGNAAIVALGSSFFGLGGALDKTNRPYGSLLGPAGEVLNFSAYTLNYAHSRKPATSTSAGSVGDLSFTTQHVYFCISASSWKRAALSGY